MVRMIHWKINESVRSKLIGHDGQRVVYSHFITSSHVLLYGEPSSARQSLKTSSFFPRNVVSVLILIGRSGKHLFFPASDWCLTWTASVGSFRNKHQVSLWKEDKYDMCELETNKLFFIGRSESFNFAVVATYGLPKSHRHFFSVSLSLSPI